MTKQNECRPIEINSTLTIGNEGLGKGMCARATAKNVKIHLIMLFFFASPFVGSFMRSHTHTQKESSSEATVNEMIVCFVRPKVTFSLSKYVSGSRYSTNRFSHSFSTSSHLLFLSLFGILLAALFCVLCCPFCVYFRYHFSFLFAGQESFVRHSAADWCVCARGPAMEGERCCHFNL